MNHWKALIAGAVAAASLTLATSAFADAAPAKVGDSLVVYSGTGFPADLADALVQPFSDYMNKKYGVPVKVQTVPGPIPTAWLRFQTEWPNPTGDVYLLYNQNVRTGIDKGYWLKQQDQFTPEEWSRFDPQAMTTLATKGYTWPMEISAWVLAVQNSVPAADVTSVADLGKPEFNHRITFDSLAVGSGYNAIAAAALLHGDDWHTWFQNGKFNVAAATPAFEIVGSWAKDALTLTQGSGSVTPLLRRGEALVSAWWWHNTIGEIAQGTPIRVVVPKEGAIATVQSGPVISAKSQNPVAAVEWVKFLNSDIAASEAAKIKYLNRLPLKGQPAPPEWQQFASKAKFVYIDAFRDTMLDPAYNQQVLDLYNKIVIQGH